MCRASCFTGSSSRTSPCWQATSSATGVRRWRLSLPTIPSKPDAPLAPDAPKLHPGGNLLRHVKIRHGDQTPRADVVVRGTYEIGMQDQAPLGPESGLAIPDREGGAELQ